MNLYSPFSSLIEGFPCARRTAPTPTCILNLTSCVDDSSVQADEGSQVEMVLRLQSRELSWNWLYICATRDTGGQGMSCTNYTVR